MNLPLTLPISATWPDRLFQLSYAVRELLGRAGGALLADNSGDFGAAVHVTQLRRLAAHGCNGQALI